MAFLGDATQSPWLEGLWVGGKGPVAMLGHCRRDSAVFIWTQATLALAALTL